MQVEIQKVLGERNIQVAYKVTCIFSNRDKYCFIDRCDSYQIPANLHEYLQVKDVVTVQEALYKGTPVDTIQSGGAGLSMILYGLSLDLTRVQQDKVFIALCGLIFSDLQLLSPCKLGTADTALPLQIGAHFSMYVDMYFSLDIERGKVVLKSDSYGKNLSLVLKRQFTNVSPYRGMLETMASIYSQVPDFLRKEGTQTMKFDEKYKVIITSEKR